MQDLLQKSRSFLNYILMSFAPQHLNVTCWPWTQLALHSAKNSHPFLAIKKLLNDHKMTEGSFLLFYYIFIILSSIPAAASGYISEDLQKIMTGYMCCSAVPKIKLWWKRGDTWHISATQLNLSADMHCPVVTLTTAAIPETQVTVTAYSSQMTRREASADLSFCSTRLHCAVCTSGSSSVSTPVRPLSQPSHAHSLHFWGFHTNYWQIPPFKTCLPLKEDWPTSQWSTICQWLGLDLIFIFCF